MPEVTTYIFFDIETTGLPWQERNQTKIIEASFVAVLREDIENSSFGVLPPLSKLSFVLNPKRPIHTEVTHLTGLSNHLLRHAPTFINKFKSLKYFLEDLPKPACLIAHNGNSFDFKILLAECLDAQVCLPRDLLCVDSLIGFRKILKGSSVSYKDLMRKSPELLSKEDEEEDWPDMNLSNQDWDEINEICTSISDISCENLTDDDSDGDLINRDLVIRQVFQRNKLTKQKAPKHKTTEQNKAANQNKESYTLSALYKRLLNNEAVNAHRAEADCLMLIECFVALKEDFMAWSDEACKLLTDIKPLSRY